MEHADPVVSAAMRAMPAGWFDFVFTPEGALRDIYVQKTDLAVWDRFLAHIAARGYPARFDAKSGFTLESPAAEILDHRRWTDRALLSIDFLPGKQANCHFFVDYEIELDIDPKDVTDTSDFEALLAFIVEMGQALSRDVLLTFENDDSAPVLTFCNTSQSVTYVWENAAPPT